MKKSNSEIEDIASNFDLTSVDIEVIKHVKRKHRVYLAMLETIIGFISFTVGYNLAPFTEKVGYPFLPLLMTGNISISTQIKKKKPFVLIIFLTLLTLLIGVMSGYTIGIALKTTYITNVNGSAIRYGVYLDCN